MYGCMYGCGCGYGCGCECGCGWQVLLLLPSTHTCVFLRICLSCLSVQPVTRFVMLAKVRRCVLPEASEAGFQGWPTKVARFFPPCRPPPSPAPLQSNFHQTYLAGLVVHYTLCSIYRHRTQDCLVISDLPLGPGIARPPIMWLEQSSFGKSTWSGSPSSSPARCIESLCFHYPV